MANSIVYTALRSIKPGHTAGTAYTINIDFIQDTPASTRIGPRPAVSLGGSQVTIVHRIEKTRDITTDYVSTATTPAIADMTEFLDSVIGGESFTVDGINYYIAGDSYRENLDGNVYRNYSFKIRQQ